MTTMVDRKHRNELDDAALESLLADVRKHTDAVPSADLLSRILADAEAEMPRLASARMPLRPQVEPSGWFAGVLSAIGGWKGFGGLVTAGVAGVWIGFSDTSALTAVGTTLMSSGTTTGTVELFPTGNDFFAADAAEG